MPRVLNDEQLAAIAWADLDERTIDLTLRIGAPFKVVRSARRGTYRDPGTSWTIERAAGADRQNRTGNSGLKFRLGGANC